MMIIAGRCYAVDWGNVTALHLQYKNFQVVIIIVVVVVQMLFAYCAPLPHHS